jgi:SAM-dependent methyltransferase
VDEARAAQLLEINRRFYLEHGQDFVETRKRVQPGVRRVLQSLRAEDSILDLGCGSGALARTLSQNGHRGCYLGLDFSPAALESARLGHYEFPARFLEVDLAHPERLQFHVRSRSEGEMAESWAVVAAFAVLHHIPGKRLRLDLLRLVQSWLRADGRFMLSNWQFSASGRMQSRIMPWSAVGMNDTDLDEGDHLIDWRRGGTGLRYVHEFGEGELAGLATESGFSVAESFLSDGADRRSGLYQTWKPA